MSFFPAYFGLRKRAEEDSAPSSEPENELRADIFNLIPPRASDKYERPKEPQSSAKAEGIEPPAKPEGRNVHPATAIDLTRLSIDDGGHLPHRPEPVRDALGAEAKAASRYSGLIVAAIRPANGLRPRWSPCR